MTIKLPVLFSLLFFCHQLNFIRANKERIELKDVDVLTLHSDRYTTSRRSSPVKQLNCVGGSAGCSKFVPRTVQCYNRGSDGYDVNWECKTDLPSDISFGKLSVSCEGYDHPNDKYVLRGSCGLEYTLDSRGKTSKNNYNGEANGFAGLFGFVAFIAVIALIYYCCIHPNQQGVGRTGEPDGVRPPPPGFREQVYPDLPTAPPSYDESQTRYRQDYRPKTTYTTGEASTSSGPGFWTGLGVGGVTGYLFGSQSSPNHHYRSSPAYSTYAPRSDYYSSSRDSSTDHGDMRTASGFATTSRR